MISLAVYSSMIVVSAFFVMLSAPIVLMAVIIRGRDRLPAILGTAVLVYSRCILRIATFPFIRVTFEKRARDDDRPGIYIFTHRSASDAFFAAYLRPPMSLLLKDMSLSLPFYGFFAKKAGYINAPRSSVQEIMSWASRLHAEGISLVAFPEGTRSGKRGINPFHTGIFHVAKELRCPIYPVCVMGNERIPDRQFRMSSGWIRVLQMPRVDPEVGDGLSPFQLKNHVHVLMQAEVDRSEGCMR